MQSPIHYRKWIWGIHFFFWILIAALLFLALSFILGNPTYALGGVIANLVGLMVLVYLHLLVLLPRWFDQEKYVSYALALVVLLLFTSGIRFFVGWGMVSQLDWDIEGLFRPSYFGSMFFSGTFFLLISIPLRLIENWFKKRELEQELKTHQLEAELRFLKAQVNPHFLFNALNNIYALSFTESKKAPEMILKLSDMMSYMLYDCKNENVALSAEVGYLRNYIDLQQLKKDGELNITFKVQGDLTGVQITPMLFIPFFENAFKHGNLEDTTNGWLHSSLRVDEGVLKFTITNSVPVLPREHEKGGVGLENIRQRLNLLYPENHELDIQSGENEYAVYLQIKLSEVCSTDA